MDNEILVKIRTMATAVNAAWKRVSAKEFELLEARGRDYDYRSDPEYKALEHVFNLLLCEERLLISQAIRANLSNMGIEDMSVTGVLHLSENERTPRGIRRRDGQEAGRVEMLLSDLCGLCSEGLAVKLGVDREAVSFDINIEKDGMVVGRIDAAGVFDFLKAPSLKTALAWKVATDGGRTRLIEGFDPDTAGRLLLETIRTHGTDKPTFFGPYFDALKRIFVCEKTSQSKDGYLSAAIPLWRVATRELGQEHEGYEFWC